MKVFEANITNPAIDFFDNSNELLLETLNSELKSICGINSFFTTQLEIDALTTAILSKKNLIGETDRAEYGDFQTNKQLSDAVCKLLMKQYISPEVIIEPTCGQGNFIISCLNTFEDIKFIYGIEVYKPYVWEAKFAILDYFLNNTKD
ncbi:MAG TPA: hypothetical protein ENI76_00810, partial [Ignavibacteria bacterium]|nr:hypothetical protein [Ignavibacteria bacterium]